MTVKHHNFSPKLLNCRIHLSLLFAELCHPLRLYAAICKYKDCALWHQSKGRGGHNRFSLRPSRESLSDQVKCKYVKVHKVRPSEA